MIVKIFKDIINKRLVSPEYYTPHLGRWRNSSQDFNNLTANYDHCGDDKCNIFNMKKTQEMPKKPLKKLKLLIHDKK
tara:strand:- start:11 stop:241 length:231 start_codon:yes stop_codon:yes gene_type:complete